MEVLESFKLRLRRDPESDRRSVPSVGELIARASSLIEVFFIIAVHLE